MQRGFDLLLTPEGIAMVTAAMFFTLAFIVFGATFVRVMERRRKAEKEHKDRE